MMDEKTLGVQKVYSTVVSFAMQQNHVPVIRQLVLQNNTDVELREIHVDIVSQPEFAVPYHTTLDAIPAGQVVNLGSIDLQLSASYLADTTEKCPVRYHWKHLRMAPCCTKRQSVSMCLRLISGVEMRQSLK
jgi:hypothetical protein